MCIRDRVTLIRWAMGHIPSTRIMGEMTTPRATIIERNTSRVTCLFLFIFFLFSAAEKGRHFLLPHGDPCGAFCIAGKYVL